jgi:hypothetical protein
MNKRTWSPRFLATSCRWAFELEIEAKPTLTMQLMISNVNTNQCERIDGYFEYKFDLKGILLDGRAQSTCIITVPMPRNDDD